MGFVLDENLIKSIGKELPDLNKIGVKFTPDLISCKFSQDSAIPVASVCFRDSDQMAYHANFALNEFYRNKIWYFKKRDPPDEMAGRVLCRFYLDDVALRLYAAAEHLANAIINMLEIDENEIIEEKKKDRFLSRQSVLGNYLKKKLKGHEITPVVKNLGENTNWIKTMDYRNKWVHEQPPTVDGLGIVYKRKNRWGNNKMFSPTLGETRLFKTLLIGGGDEPDYTIDKILEFVKPALFLFVDTLSSVENSYSSLLKKSGIEIDDEKRITIKF